MVELGHQQRQDLAVTVAVYAALAYDVISATNSSPQTTEINAASRGPTLMKWVRIGLVQAVGFGLIGAWFDPRRWPPLVGVGVACTLLWAQYAYALRAGQASGAPGTETSW